MAEPDKQEEENGGGALALLIWLSFAMGLIIPRIIEWFVK